MCYDMSRQEWEVIGTISAGDQSAQFDLKDGQAVRIFTGAGMPKTVTSNSTRVS